jgi:hypothetical protein
MSEEARISIGSYLGMRRGEVTFVPLLLTAEQESLFFAATDLTSFNVQIQKQNV